MNMGTTAKANGNGTLVVQWGLVAKALATLVTVCLVSLVTAVIINWGTNGKQDVRLAQHDAILGTGQRYTTEDARADRASNDAAHLALQAETTRLRAEQAAANAALAKATAALEALAKVGDQNGTDLRALAARLDRLQENLSGRP